MAHSAHGNNYLDTSGAERRAMMSDVFPQDSERRLEKKYVHAQVKRYAHLPLVLDGPAESQEEVDTQTWQGQTTLPGASIIKTARCASSTTREFAVADDII